MSKPLGYYTNYTPGEDTLLASLQEEYGATFEKITVREKLVILTALASHMGCQLEGDCRAEIFALAKQITDAGQSHTRRTGNSHTLGSRCNQRWNRASTLTHLSADVARRRR
ncbi:hypothetical protein [Nostoc sp.]|uniref:hypothetical protein n=1 Tax=Nostoc sp. TaxID=1180 RepID=UPI002FFA6642